MTFYDVLHKTPGKWVDSEDDNSRGKDMIRKSKQNSIFDALVAYASEKKIQEVNMNYIFAYIIDIRETSLYVTSVCISFVFM